VTSVGPAPSAGQLPAPAVGPAEPRASAAAEATQTIAGTLRAATAIVPAAAPPSARVAEVPTTAPGVASSAMVAVGAVSPPRQGGTGAVSPYPDLRPGLAIAAEFWSPADTSEPGLIRIRPLLDAAPMPPTGGAAPVHAMLTARLLAGPGGPPVAPAGGPVPATEPPTTIVQGTIVALTAERLPIVRTDAGLLRLLAVSQWPLLTEISLELRRRVSTESSDAPWRTATAPGTKPDWRALGGAIDALASGADGGGGRTVPAGVPRSSHGLTIALLHFLATLDQADLEAWLDAEPVRLLEGRAPDFAPALREELRLAARQAGDELPGGWRQILVPIVDAGTLSVVRILLRAQRDGGDGRRDGDAGVRRFVVELDLSRLGPLQLDGLVDPKTRRFDLVLRAERALSPPIRADIAALLENARDILGFHGGLRFTSGATEQIGVPSPTPPGRGILV
jgi:hypothetical protein